MTFYDSLFCHDQFLQDILDCNAFSMPVATGEPLSMESTLADPPWFAGDYIYYEYVVAGDVSHFNYKDPEFGSPLACGLSPYDSRIYHPKMYHFQPMDFASDAFSSELLEFFGFGQSTLIGNDNDEYPQLSPLPIQWYYFIDESPLVDISWDTTSPLANSSQSYPNVHTTPVLTPLYLPSATNSQCPHMPPYMNLYESLDNQAGILNEHTWTAHMYHDPSSTPYTQNSPTSHPPTASVAIGNETLSSYTFVFNSHAQNQVVSPDLGNLDSSCAIRDNKRKRPDRVDSNSDASSDEMENATQRKRRRTSKKAAKGISDHMSQFQTYRVMPRHLDPRWILETLAIIEPDDSTSDTASPEEQPETLTYAEQHNSVEGKIKHSSTEPVSGCKECRRYVNERRKRENDSKRAGEEAKCYHDIFNLLASSPLHDVSRSQHQHILEDAIKYLSGGILPDAAQTIKNKNSGACTLKRDIERQRRALITGYIIVLRGIVSPQSLVADPTRQPELTRLQVLRIVRELFLKACLL